MNKVELLELVDSLGLPKSEYYILSGGSLLLFGLRQEANDLDLCVSKELFKVLKNTYGLKQDDKTETGFYPISENIEIVPNDKENFKMKIRGGYPVETLESILKFKRIRNTLKDKEDIRNIEKYLEEVNKDDPR